MSTTILVTENAGAEPFANDGPPERRGYDVFVIAPRPPASRLGLSDALEPLETLREVGRRFDAATLLCDERADCAAMYVRARVARTLVSILRPGGRMQIDVPAATAELESELRGLVQALAAFGPAHVSIDLRVRSRGRDSGVYRIADLVDDAHAIH